MTLHFDDNPKTNWPCIGGDDLNDHLNDQSVPTLLSISVYGDTISVTGDQLKSTWPHTLYYSPFHLEKQVDEKNQEKFRRRSNGGELTLPVVKAYYKPLELEHDTNRSN